MSRAHATDEKQMPWGSRAHPTPLNKGRTPPYSPKRHNMHQTAARYILWFFQKKCSKIQQKWCYTELALQRRTTSDWLLHWCSKDAPDGVSPKITELTKMQNLTPQMRAKFYKTTHLFQKRTTQQEKSASRRTSTRRVTTEPVPTHPCHLEH